MLAQVVVCVDQTLNAAAVAGSPCPVGQGLVSVSTEIFAPGSAFDVLQASEFFMYGFGVIIFAYLLGFAVAQVRKPIRQGN
jgi:predicted transporter